MTCSAAKHEANRANSIHSTGPRTEEGKAGSSRNSLSHGLTATFPVILPGEQPEFDSLREGLYLSIRPEGTLEDVFFSRLVHATWNLRRCDLIEVSIAPAADPLASSDDTAQQRAVNVDLYRNRAERTLYRCTKELRLLQSERSTREFAAARENPIPAIAVEVVPPMANLVLTNQFSKPRPGALFRDGRLDWEFGERRIAERRERLEAEAQAAVDQAAEMREDAAAESESEPNEAMEPAPVCTTYRREGPKTGRNEPCPCGSGAKFKRCCGR